MASDSTDTNAGANPPSLPRSFRGYDRRATEELFRRLSWEYSVLAGEHRKLKQAMEELPPGAGAGARTRTDFDEEAHALLAAAHKAAREMRESAKAECEQAIRKAKSRAAEIEAEAARATVESTGILQRAAAVRAMLGEALRALERGETPAAQPAARTAEPEPERFPVERDHPATP